MQPWARSGGRGQKQPIQQKLGVRFLEERGLSGRSEEGAEGSAGEEGSGEGSVLSETSTLAELADLH